MFPACAEPDARTRFASDPDISEVGAEDEAAYDFSMFFGHTMDPIVIDRILTRYKVETDVNIRAITTEADARNERFLRRYLNASDPPAAFVFDEVSDRDALVAAGYVTTAPAVAVGAAETTGGGLAWRYRGIGFAADGRVLADLFGTADADRVVEDIRLSTWTEWTAFIAGLEEYISDTTSSVTPVAFSLNGKPYAFVPEKGGYSADLNGVFALEGSDSAFVSALLLDRATATSGKKILSISSILSTPQALSAATPVFDAYTSALETYTDHLGGLYAEGIRGDDFVNVDIYSPEYAVDVFAAGRAVFFPFDSEQYDALKETNATQAEHIVLLPVKMPYSQNGLSEYASDRPSNRALHQSVTYSLHVNVFADAATRAKAADFVTWLASDEQSMDPVQRQLKTYYERNAVLPLETDEEMAEFEERVYESPVLKSRLTDSVWDDADIGELKDDLFERWYRGAA
jgi:hypothetical protein